MRQEASKKKYLGHNSGVYSAVLFFVCVVLLVLMMEVGMVSGRTFGHALVLYIQEVKIAGNEEIL
jgi:hypothetical protein